MLAAEENIIVVVRVRPIQKIEESKGEVSCVESVSNGKEVREREREEKETEEREKVFEAVDNSLFALYVLSMIS
jgi:hypothetical protein